jgi:formylglycine-generating enzyme required for sulfatase activity
VTQRRRWSTLLTLAALVACGREPPTPAEWTDPATGMSFVLVRPGRFLMGLGEDAPDLRPAPRHTVRLTSAFYLGRTEVTQGQWRTVMGTAPSHFTQCGDDCPVEQVSWYDVQTFLERLHTIEPGERFRLPTEAEWEYACRAGTVTRYAQGDTLQPADANFDGRIPFDGVRYDYFRGHPTPAASFPPNGWGLYDMAGNVWEWTGDEYCPYPTGSVVDPHPSCGTDTVVIRGGSWYFSANAARCGRRYIHARQDSGFSLGFRVVREIASLSEARDVGGD